MTNHPNRSKRNPDLILKSVGNMLDRFVEEQKITFALTTAAEALIEKIAHVNGIEAERAALIAACVKAHGGGNA